MHRCLVASRRSSSQQTRPAAEQQTHIPSCSCLLSLIQVLTRTLIEFNLDIGQRTAHDAVSECIMS